MGGGQRAEMEIRKKTVVHRNLSYMNFRESCLQRDNFLFHAPLWEESNKYIHMIIQEKLVIGDVAETKRSPALPKQIFILRGTLTSRPLS